MGGRKKFLVNVIIGIFFALCVYNLGIYLYDFKLSVSNTYKIFIHNKTNKALKDLELSFYNGDIIEKIENIDTNKSCMVNLNTKNINGETSLYLTYKDNKGNIQKVCVVGYLEKGYGGIEKIKIKSSNKEGILEIN
ncbi:hypothetical protein [Clostridium tarantellae]|uniref:Uncharacterized protein n=1 Tax=Clostridium tarantellae TaxID=39493 RepID=A0A6I1MJG6_9CLOT|nr:hypothetical protein [Clostridium tarantellae]MPQ43230.1 hypothetical protein [Clostridium tarantellae]